MHYSTISAIFALYKYGGCVPLVPLVNLIINGCLEASARIGGFMNKLPKRSYDFESFELDNVYNEDERYPRDNTSIWYN